MFVYFCTQIVIMERIHGIVLRQVKYGESGQIVDLFTDSHGRMSVMVKAGGSRQSARRHTSSAVRMMPMLMVEFDCNIHGQGRLVHPQGLTPYYIYRTAQFDPVKSTMLMFTCEFLQNALREEGPNHLLYQYVEHSMQWLDAAERGVANFHLVFLMRMMQFLGITPNLDTFSPVYFYDLMNAEFRYGQPSHPHFLRPDEAKTIPYIYNMRMDNMHLYRFNRHQRRRILEVITDYMRIHLPGFRELKSLDVLSEVFD